MYTCVQGFFKSRKMDRTNAVNTISALAVFPPEAVVGLEKTFHRISEDAVQIETLMPFSPLGVEVGLKTPYQIVRENESPALVCAVVDSPDKTNPSSVSFPFDIHFHFNGARDSASREYTS